MDIINLSGENICSFESIDVPLHRQGLVWVGGDNSDSKAANSNGAGKSNLFKVISWSMYGQTIDGEDGDAIIRSGTKCARTVLECRDGEDEWRVIRERRRGAPRLALYRNGAPQPGGRQELQAQLDQLYGLDFQAFRNTSMYGQRDLDRFLEPRVTDATRKQVLQRILRTQLFAVCFDWIREQNLELKHQVAEVEGEISEANARIEEVDVDGVQAEVDSWEEERTARAASVRSEALGLVAAAREAKGAVPDVAVMERRLKEMERERAEAEGRSAGLEGLEDALAEAERIAATAEAERRAAERESSAAMARYNEVSGEDTCPTCGTSFIEGHGMMFVDSLKGDWVEAKSRADAAKTKANAARAAVGPARLARDAAREGAKMARAMAKSIALQKEAISAAREHLGNVLRMVDESKRKLSEAKAIEIEANPHSDRLAAAVARRDELLVEVSAKHSALEMLTNERSHYEFWARGFGPTGMPSFALDKWMPYLTERANHYLNILADGDIVMNFASQRVTKGGDHRDEIGITWTIEGVEGYPPSGGQFRKMSVSTDFALMDLACAREGTSLDLLCLDECLDGLDAEGRERILQLLHSLRSRRGTILLISQEADIAEVFERALLVRKLDKVSTIEAIR